MRRETGNSGQTGGGGGRLFDVSLSSFFLNPFFYLVGIDSNIKNSNAKNWISLTGEVQDAGGK